MLALQMLQLEPIRWIIKDLLTFLTLTNYFCFFFVATGNLAETKLI